MKQWHVNLLKNKDGKVIKEEKEQQTNEMQLYHHQNKVTSNVNLKCYHQNYGDFKSKVLTPHPIGLGSMTSNKESSRGNIKNLK